MVLVSINISSAREIESVNEILNDAFTTEKAIGSLRIKGMSWKELWNSKSSKWNQLPLKSKFVLHTTGALENRIRVDFNPRIVEWFNGPRPYNAYREQLAFNGSWVTKSEEMVDENEKPLTSPLGGISDFNPSRDFFMDLETPVGYTLLNIRGVANVKLWDSKFLESEFTVVEGEKFEGHTSIVIKKTMESYSQTIVVVYFGKQPLLKSMKIERFDKNGLGNGNVTEFTVSKYMPILGTEAFYPSEMCWQLSQNQIPEARFTVSISLIERIPDLDKEFFSIPFKAGTRVEDERCKSE